MTINIYKMLESFTSIDQGIYHPFISYPESFCNDTNHLL